MQPAQLGAKMRAALHPNRKQVFLWRRTGMGMSVFEAIKSQRGKGADY